MTLSGCETEQRNRDFPGDSGTVGTYEHVIIIQPLIVLEILVKGDLKRHLMSLKPK